MYFKSNHSHGVGYGGAVLGGSALGALAAGAAAAADGDCYLESRRVVDEFGNVYSAACASANDRKSSCG
jgi:hypothetical protein